MLRVEEENEEMQNWILFQTVINSDREFVSEPHKKVKNKENFIRADEFSFEKMKTFLMKNSCCVEKENEEMQNWILFHTLTNWDREFGSHLQKKLKNKENFIRADEFSFEKMKISLQKNSSWK